MTLPAPTMDVNCPVCGAVNQVDRLLSTHSFGSPDLDLRPAPDEGRLLEYMIESCQACKYSAGTLDAKPLKGTGTAMSSPEWVAIGKRKGLPKLAAAFKRAELICTHSHEPRGAVHMALRAVWVCDDRKSSLAPALRRETAERIQQAMTAGKPYSSQVGGNEALITDLLRRAEDWQEATNWATKGLAVVDYPLIEAVLRLELKLIEGKDAKVHRIEEAEC